MVHHVVNEAFTRCVVSFVSQHVAVFSPIVKADDADVVYLVDIVRLVGRW